MTTSVSKLRILHVISSMDPSHGGVCQAVRTMIVGQPDGHEAEVVCMDAPDAGYLAQDPFVIHAVGPAANPWAYSPRLIPWLLENIQRYDRVIIHGLWLFHSHAVRKVMRKLKGSAPGVLPQYWVMPHGMLDPYFQRDPSRRLKAMRNLLYWKLIERRVVNDAAGVLLTCEEEKLLARETFRDYQPSRECVVGLGVEAPPACSSQMRDTIRQMLPLGDAPYLLFLSRIHPKKGVDLMIQAYARLIRERQSQGSADRSLPHLVIAGPLEGSYAEEMQQLAAQLFPASESADSIPRIHFAGMLRGDAKWGAFYECEAFVLPSHQENFGIAVVEALACFKPVLITKKVNIWREIAAEGAGFAEDDTPEGVETLLSSWLDLPDSKRTEMTGKAHSAFTKFYSVEAAAMRVKEAI